MSEKYYISSASGLKHGPFGDISELTSYYRGAEWEKSEHPLIAVGINPDGSLDDAWVLNLDTEYGVEGCKILREIVNECVDGYYEMWAERYEQSGGGYANLV